MRRTRVLPAIPRYLVIQILGPMAFFTFVFTAVLWLRQSLRLLDYMMRGQSAATIAEMTLLVLPTVIVWALPIALVLAAMYAVDRMHRESELVVLWASGLSKLTILKSVMAASSVGMAICYVMAVWVAPMAQARLNGRVFDIRGDLTSTTFQEGAFSTPAGSNGLTVYIKERGAAGELKGILVHDARNEAQPTTYVAQHGRLVRTPEGPRLVMYDGTRQEVSRHMANGQPDVNNLDFQDTVLDLAQFGASGNDRWRQPAERSLDELFHPNWSPDDQKSYNLLIAEGHKRLSGPLYAFIMPLLAFVVLVYGEFSRRGFWWRYVAAFVLVTGVRIVGLSIESLAVSEPRANLLMYLWPCIVGLAAILALTDRTFLLQRRFATRFAHEGAKA